MNRTQEVDTGIYAGAPVFGMDKITGEKMFINPRDDKNGSQELALNEKLYLKYEALPIAASQRSLDRDPDVMWKTTSEDNELLKLLRMLQVDYIIDGMLFNPNIPMDIILRHKWHISHTRQVSRHPDMSAEILRKNPSLDWDFNVLSKNLNISLEFIMSTEFPWCWGIISTRSDVNFSIIMNTPKLPWDWSCLSMNPNITPDDVKNNPGRRWDIRGLSVNSSMIPLIEKSLSITIGTPPRVCQWDTQYLSINPGLTTKIATKYKHIKGWRWDYLSSNPAMTLEMILPFYKEKLFGSHSWMLISMHPNITFQTIKNNPHLPWDYIWMAYNINISLRTIINNDNYNWHESFMKSMAIEIINGDPYEMLGISENTTSDRIKRILKYHAQNLGLSHPMLKAHELMNKLSKQSISKRRKIFDILLEISTNWLEKTPAYIIYAERCLIKKLFPDGVSDIIIQYCGGNLIIIDYTYSLIPH